MKKETQFENPKVKALVFSNELDGQYPYSEVLIRWKNKQILSYSFSVETENIKAKLDVYPTKDILLLDYNYKDTDLYDRKMEINQKLTIRGLLGYYELEQWAKVWLSHLNDLYNKYDKDDKEHELNVEEERIINYLLRALLHSINIIRDNSILEDVKKEIETLLDDKPLNIVEIQ